MKLLKLNVYWIAEEEKQEMLCELGIKIEEEYEEGEAYINPEYVMSINSDSNGMALVRMCDGTCLIACQEIEEVVKLISNE